MTVRTTDSSADAPAAGRSSGAPSSPRDKAHAGAASRPSRAGRHKSSGGNQPAKPGSTDDASAGRSGVGTSGDGSGAGTELHGTELVAGASRTQPSSLEPARSSFAAEELQRFRGALLTERERLLHEAAGLREESLLRHDEVNHEEDGTDAFIRLSGLDRAGQELAQVAQIDEALRAIDDNTYGLCEGCGCCIEPARLELLPFVKTCVRCQSEAEGGQRARISARARLWQ